MNATNAYNRLNANVAGLKKASEKLSSGYRINRAGDDAAGLAISEKMRSQIKGLNQATRNAQDGINMIQTFEGAAQETHSILQRMKELATESANGTYDNPTDRAAIELEFGQLNDELNQIADTDYNGTIVLNGGEMADGLKEVDGEFNYAKAAEGNTGAVTAKDVTTYTEKPNGANEHQKEIVDNSNYTKADAKKIWEGLGITGKGVSKVDVTFVYDGSNWKATTASNLLDANDKAVTGVKADAKGLKTTASAVNKNDGKGGFSINGTTVNAIFNSYNANKGDYLTITFENDETASYAPNNAGLMEDSLTMDETHSNFGSHQVKTTVTLDEDITTDKMTAEMKDALDNLQKAEFKFDVDADGNMKITFSDGTTTDTTNKLKLTDNGDGTASIKDTAKDIELATIKIEIDENAGADTTKVTAAEKQDGTKITDTKIAATVTAGTYKQIATGDWLKDGATSVTAAMPSFKNATTGTALTPAAGDKVVIDAGGALDASSNVGGAPGGNMAVNSGDLTGLAAGKTYVFDGTDWYNQDDIVVAADITSVTGFDTGSTVVVGTEKAAVGNGTFKLNVDGYHYTADKQLACNSKTTDPKVVSSLSGSGDDAITTANAFKNSTARMTYTDNITLQTGARTKDAVNFSFKYNTDNSADMGDLKANLNLSSREDGLNTANLSLANQEDANYAIDQIDKAINKTSLVRATFGSIQNRLEHKITNLTTTNENLTEAESSIRDTDMASEMMNYTKFNILQQAAQSMLAQANQQPQSVLQLLG